MTEVHEITLSTIERGAAEELFQSALRDVMRSLDDPNTDYKAKRRISLSFSFSIDEKREHAIVYIECASKLPGIKGILSPMYLGRHLGELRLIEAPKQEDMFSTPKGGPRAIKETAGGEQA